MTVLAAYRGARFLLVAAFGPHEIPRWPLLPILAPAAVALVYLRLRKAV